MKRWSRIEDEILISAREKGLKIAEVTELVDRSLESIKTRYSILKKRGLINEHGNKRWTDKELLDFVIKYKTTEAGNCNRETTEPWPTTVCRRFGSWTEALKLAGLHSNKGNLLEEAITILYFVHFPKYDLYKVGITQRTVSKRFDNLEVVELDSRQYLSLSKAREVEKELLRLVKPHKAKDCPPELYKNGFSECFFNKSLSKLSKLEDLYTLK